MNDLGVTLIWLAGRVTVVSAVVLIADAVLRTRRRNHSPSFIGIVTVLALTIALISPWPRWDFESSGEDSVSVTDTAAANATDRPRSAALIDAPQTAGQSDVELEPPWSAAVTGFMNGLGRDLDPPAASAPVERTPGLRWTGWFAIIFFVAADAGTLGLLFGWLSVKRSVRRSVVVHDAGLQQELEILQAQMSCPSRIELRESTELSSAATLGIFRPLILLPATWREWTDDELRTVLAHEIAHIRSGDSFAWLLAQLGLLIHYYHPLVHWMVRRLGLDQELEADALAAQATGGPQSYLIHLAELAIRQPTTSVAWPARAFLPTRGTLLRRIEMLKEPRGGAEVFSAWRRRMVVVATLVTALFVAGIRRPDAQVAAAEPAPDPRPASVAEDLFNLEGVARDTRLLFGVRPAELIARKDLKPVVELLQEQMNDAGFALSDLDQVLVMGIPMADREGRMSQPVLEFRFRKAPNASKYASWQVGGEVDDFSVDGVAVLAQFDPSETDRVSVVHMVDDRTFVSGQFRDVVRVVKSRKQPEWIGSLDAARTGQALVAMDVNFIRPEIERDFTRTPNPMLGMMRPLWQNTEMFILRAAVRDSLDLVLEGHAANEDSAAEIAQTVKNLLPVAKGLLAGSQQAVAQAPKEAQTLIQKSIMLTQQALETTKVTQDGTIASVTLGADGLGVATLTGLLLPAVKTAREAAMRSQSANNIKQIMLALHNYHDAYRAFPPAVLLGPDGKTKYSWRVAILPFIEQQALYRQYRFDEPWDSEANKKVLAQVPPVYQFPSEKGSQNASYFGLVGRQTGLGNTPGEGEKLREFTDGTANTIVIVEAKRDIPWTKPEDIPYADDGDLPKLGGYLPNGWNSGLGDGSVRFISEAVDEEVLRNLFRKDDGNPIDRQKL